MRFVDLTGKTFGRLTIIEYSGSRKGGGAEWRAKCECGSISVYDGANLRYGRTKSCGCLRKEGRKKKHGMSRTPTHNIWSGILQRCENKSAKAFAHYGGRGITVCDRWKTFENFLLDMGERPHGMSIERIDNNAGYEPKNCVWATMLQQARNKRTTVTYEHNGKDLPLKEWAELLGLPYKVLWHRHRIGKTGSALFAPLRAQAKTKT